jgi:hypothetical protein
VAPQIDSRLRVAPQKLPPHHVWLERALGITIPGGRGNG